MARKHPGELAIPLSARGDDEALEMLRVWIADGTIRVSPNLGLWADAEGVDERDAWGQLLSDVIKVIARGLYLSHGMDKVESATRIRDALLWNLATTDGAVEGRFVED